MSDKKFELSEENILIFGLCGGISEYFAFDANIIRIIWIISIFFFGVGLGLYIVVGGILWFMK